VRVRGATLIGDRVTPISGFDRGVDDH